MKGTKEFFIGLVLLVAAALLYLAFQNQTRENGSITKSRPTVTVYVSEDRVFSEPVLQAFEKTTGIKVHALYDTEEAKSTGVMNRLIAEKSHPHADVYWANEPIRAEVLKQRGIADVYHAPQAAGIPDRFKDKEGYWCGFSARARVLLVKKGLSDPPDSIEAYLDPRYKGRAVIANPLFGTTTAHIAALFSYWGDDRAQAFLRGLKHNDVALATSNGDSADLVAKGRYDFALVDSDDAIARIRRGEKVAMIYPDQKKDQMGLFLVPNAVVLIKGAPHPENAKKLIDFLLSKKSERMLAFADCAQIPLHPDVPMPHDMRPIDTLKIMPVDYGRVAKKLLQIQPILKQWTME